MGRVRVVKMVLQVLVVKMFLRVVKAVLVVQALLLQTEVSPLRDQTESEEKFLVPVQISLVLI